MKGLFLNRKNPLRTVGYVPSLAGTLSTKSIITTEKNQYKNHKTDLQTRHDNLCRLALGNLFKFILKRSPLRLSEDNKGRFKKKKTKKPLYDYAYLNFTQT